jgi:uncharacterized metal-binding protein
MKKVLPILADLANGIFATFLASWIVGINPTWHFVVGILFAMSPDLDAISELWNRGIVVASSRHLRDHRAGFHYPILFIIIGVILIYFSQFWGLLFLIATVLHFFNDLYGTGWGISILWPFSSRRYKLFARRINYLPKYLLVEQGHWARLSNEDRQLHFIVSWRDDELPEFIRRYGIENWIDIFYLNLNWTSAIEYGLFLLSLLLLGAHFFNF